MDQMVHTFITKHQLIQPQETIIVAVSGGPDSMALLHYLWAKQDIWKLKVIAASVDHGLRGKVSLDDLQYVKETCEEWGIEFHGTSVDVKSYKQKTGLGTQQAARELRYQFFESLMREVNATVLAMGHHGDDQAETVLMQVARSARPEAIQGMPVQRSFANGRIIRPFLCLSKEDITAYCSHYHLVPRIDASNEETDYTRNAFRKYVIPFLKGQNPKLSQHMQGMSERIREDQSYIKEQAEKVLETMNFSSDRAHLVQLSIQIFKTFPLALQRRAFHLILNYLYNNQTEEISYLHEEMFVNLLNDQKPNAELDFPQGLKIIRAYDEVTFSFSSKEHHEEFTEVLDIGESVELPDGSMVTAEWSERRQDEGPHVFVCDSHHVKPPFIVRTRRPGDRMRVRGMKGSKKVKDIFIDQKIPAQLRETWPLVVDGHGQVLWLIGLKKGGGCTDENAGTWLRLQYKNKADT